MPIVTWSVLRPSSGVFALHHSQETMTRLSGPSLTPLCFLFCKERHSGIHFRGIYSKTFCTIGSLPYLVLRLALATAFFALMDTSKERCGRRVELSCGCSAAEVFHIPGSETVNSDRPINYHFCHNRNILPDPVQATHNQANQYGDGTQPELERLQTGHKLPTEKLPDNVNSGFIFPEITPHWQSQVSLQDLLNMFPITTNTSHVSRAFNPLPILAPTERPVSSVTSIKSSLPSNAAVIFPGINSSLILPDSDSTVNASIPNYNHPDVREANNIRNKRPMLGCDGPICRSRKGRRPERNSSKCTYQFCKKCCVQFQATGHSGKCSVRTHNVAREQVTPNIRPEEPSNELISSNPYEPRLGLS